MLKYTFEATSMKLQISQTFINESRRNPSLTNSRIFNVSFIEKEQSIYETQYEDEQNNQIYFEGIFR